MATAQVETLLSFAITQDEQLPVDSAGIPDIMNLGGMENDGCRKCFFRYRFDVGVQQIET